MSSYHVQKEFQIGNFKRPPLQQYFSPRDSHQLTSETFPEFIKGGVRCVLVFTSPGNKTLYWSAHLLYMVYLTGKLHGQTVKLQHYKANLKTQR